MKKILLTCGIAFPLLYAAMNIFIPLQWKEYDIASQTVSELSAIGAPTRPIWFFWGFIYQILVLAFGWGIRMSAGHDRKLKIIGGLMIASGIAGFFWPPMHLRGAERTISDTGHIVWTAIVVPLMMLQMGFGAAAFGKKFQIYTVLSLAVLVFFGILTGIDGPKVAANLPTPHIGIWERINIGAYMLWVAVLAFVLFKRKNNPDPKELSPEKS